MLEEKKNLVQVGDNCRLHTNECPEIEHPLGSTRNRYRSVPSIIFRVSDSDMHSSFILPTLNAKLKRMIKCDKIRRNECLGGFDMKQNASVLCYTQTRPCLLWMWDVRS